MSAVGSRHSRSDLWDLVVDGPSDGFTNMAVDAALLADVEDSPNPRTIVRFYRWLKPTVSLGRSQKLDNAIDVDYCEGHGIDVVRRPTGGRAVLHDDELTYAVVSNDASHFGDTIYGNYKSISEALCGAFTRIGVPAVLAPDTRKAAHADNSADPPCFLSASRYELTVHGRKVAGSAQRRLRRSFLQHGSLPVTCDRDTLARATRMTDSSLLYEEMAGLGEFLPVRPSIEDLTNALIASFRSRFSIDFSGR